LFTLPIPSGSTRKLRQQPLQAGEASSQRVLLDLQLAVGVGCLEDCASVLQIAGINWVTPEISARIKRNWPVLRLGRSSRRKPA
jgi:hypothetical protein